MSVSVRNAVEFTIPDVPPSLSNSRLSPMQRYVQSQEWQAMVSRLARQAMNQAGWRPAEQGEQRRLTITLYRCGRTLDALNSAASVKDIADGLLRWHRKKVGRQMVAVEGCGLLYDDDLRHLPLRLIEVEQAPAGARTDERTVVRVERA